MALNFKLIDQTFEIEHGEWIYRIVYQVEANRASVKRCHRDSVSWTHSVLVKFWDGVEFVPAYQANSFYFSDANKALEFIESQES